MDCKETILRSWSLHQKPFNPDRHQRNYLSFYFNHVLGSNFHQWLYTLRIEEAKQIILHNPGVKISEVASAVGIPVIYNFSRWFKSITGMTAVTWRNMCRAEIAEKSEKIVKLWKIRI